MADAMKDDLVCPICLELYNHPIILPCSHILCRDCSSHLFEHNFIKCPVCRGRSYVTGGIDVLPRVIALENIIHRIRHRSSDSNEAENDKINAATSSSSSSSDESGDDAVLCQMCDGKQRRAKRSCQDCNASYCSNCLQISHPARAPFTEHRLIEPILNPRPKDALCPDHHERGSMYCEDCNQLACVICMELKQHDKHHLQSIECAFAVNKGVIMENMKKLSSSHEMVQDAIHAQQLHIDNLRENVDDRKCRINVECDSLLSEIENKRIYFLADLEYENRCKASIILDIHNEYKSQASKLENLILCAGDLLRQDNQGTFLQLASHVNKQLIKGYRNSNGLPMLPKDGAQLKIKSVDFRKERVLLKQLNYLSAPSTPIIDVTKCSRSWNKVVLLLSNSTEVINSYSVYYCTEEEKQRGVQKVEMFKTPLEERTSFHGLDQGQAMVLVIPNLDSNMMYYFGVKAANTAGESTTSDIVNCTTLESIDISIPIPKIETTLCQTLTSSIQIYCDTPSISRPSNVHFYLMCRESYDTASRIWKSKPMSQHGINRHRVFGLQPFTRYEFVILSCGENGACQMSESVFLTTENTAC